MNIVPSYGFFGPHHNSLRIDIGPREGAFYPLPKIQENIENSFTYIDLPIYDTYFLDVTLFPLEVQTLLAPLLKHPKIEII
jgi:hypothetical protein